MAAAYHKIRSSRLELSNRCGQACIATQHTDCSGLEPKAAVKTPRFEQAGKGEAGEKRPRTDAQKYESAHRMCCAVLITIRAQLILEQPSSSHYRRAMDKMQLGPHHTCYSCDSCIAAAQSPAPRSLGTFGQRQVHLEAMDAQARARTLSSVELLKQSVT